MRVVTTRMMAKMMGITRMIIIMIINFIMIIITLIRIIVTIIVISILAIKTIIRIIILIVVIWHYMRKYNEDIDACLLECILRSYWLGQ